jgi:hypothetical protein
VKLGSPEAAPAAGAFPPPPVSPPPPLSVDVVSVDVDSVDDDSVEPVLDESGVVVVIVVTTVVLPVVIVVTIVVVAWAPNGAAPAVNAAVAAPSVIKVAKAEPQRAYLRYLLMRFPLPRRARTYSRQLCKGYSLVFNGLHVHA